MCHLRRGFSELHLAHLFGVAQSTISRIFISWINYMYLKFGQICIWSSHQIVSERIPEDFKEKYLSTWVIIDCTEVRCEMPSSLLLDTELFISYEDHVTLKALVGIAPNGVITFVSQLKTGSISDCEIVEEWLSFAAVSRWWLCHGRYQDVLPLGVSLNIQPFLGSNSQMCAEDVIKTQQIASQSINVERAINKM